MANVVKIKNSDVDGRQPTSLLDGELAINLKNGRLFYNDASSNSINYFIADPKEIFSAVVDYRRSNLNDLKDQKIDVYSKVRPPYTHDYRYYSELDFVPTSETVINKVNIQRVEKVDVGEYKLYFVSLFPNNTYTVSLDVQKFDNFGEELSYGAVFDRETNTCVVKTGKTNISDVNVIDRYDVSRFTIKIFL